jgi:acyl carrier protein
LLLKKNCEKFTLHNNLSLDSLAYMNRVFKLKSLFKFIIRHEYLCECLEDRLITTIKLTYDTFINFFEKRNIS